MTSNRRHPYPLAILVFLAPFTLLVACGGGSESATDTRAQPAAAEAPLLSSGGRPVGETPAGGDVEGRLVWNFPDGWIEEPPANSMRITQATVPGPGGDAQLAVFFFGPGGGGGTEANIQRWIGQMEVEEGTEPTRDRFRSGPMTITTVEVDGTILPSGMGMGPTEPQPGSRLHGAVVEGPGGPWFFKLTGPAETLDAQRDAMLGMLGALTIE